MKVLVCPLNWGLGHATRCVPIIRKLVTEGHEVVIVADGYPLAFLQQQFLSLRFIEYPSYEVYYAAGKSQVGAMIFNFPNILKGIIQEHIWLRNLLRREYFDQVISDNRFGMWNKRIHSIYMTHQLMVKMPVNLKFLEPFVHRIHRTIINRYDECWIPDRAVDGGLSGDLAHKYPLPSHARFIGTLSRFKELKNIQANDEYEIVAVISGPEPQRTIFEDYLLQIYRNSSEKTLIVRGQPQIENYHRRYIGNITLVPHLSDTELAAVLLGAKKIICRSGYSSIMDLDALQCLPKAGFIPTPGQTEQEYLSSIYS
jgi:uncharacterized protein (TIGR00661 family)